MGVLYIFPIDILLEFLILEWVYILNTTLNFFLHSCYRCTHKSDIYAIRFSFKAYCLILLNNICNFVSSLTTYIFSITLLHMVFPVDYLRRQLVFRCTNLLKALPGVHISAQFYEIKVTRNNSLLLLRNFFILTKRCYEIFNSRNNLRVTRYKVFGLNQCMNLLFILRAKFINFIFRFYHN